MRFFKTYTLTGHIAFGVLFLLALWFAEERVLLTDSAYQLFDDINSGGMLVNDNRFSMVLSQLLPWLMIKLHLPLKLIIIGYSLSFLLLCYACYLLTAYLLKDRKAAVLMVFAFIGICSTFFHCISETFQLMFYAPMVYALAVYNPGTERRRKTLRWVGLVLAEVLAFFIHPVAVFFLLFIIGFRLIDGNRLRVDSTTVVLSVVLVLCVGVKLLAGQSGHDQSFMPNGDTAKALLSFFSVPSFDYFRQKIFVYLIPIMLWLLTLVGYARQRQWLKLSFVSLYVIAFFVLSVVIYWKGDGPIGMERTYLPLFFFMGLPFFYDELPRLKQWMQWTVYGCCLLMTVVSFRGIMKEMTNYANRLQEVHQIAEYGRQQGQHKLIVTQSTAERLFPINMWGLALESMMYSARDGADQTVTIYIEDDDFDRSNADFYDNPEVYMSVNWWKRWEVKDLNPCYFQLPAQGYKELLKTEKGYEIVPLRMVSDALD